LVNTLLDGRYLVQTPIASGGTSTVYRGLDVRLDRPVAVKVMDSRHAGDHQFLPRVQ
jgi:serine/threonine-protein kinase